MRVLVAYASRHGATEGIAEHLGARLTERGLEAEVRDVDDDVDPEGFDAFVIGAAAYMFHWLKSARHFVERHEELLSRHPVWLFSSGPVGEELVDDDGNDILVTSRPQEFDDLQDRLEPRGEQVFFGAWDPSAPAVGVAEWAMKLLPASAVDTLPAGDFRDWDAIADWADGIADELLGTDVSD